MLKFVQSPCPVCGAKNYDRGRFHALLGLCVFCAAEPDEVRARIIVLRIEGRVRQRPDGPPCCYPAGHPKKVEMLAERVRLGQNLWNRFDAGVDAHEEFVNEKGENAVQPVIEREYQDVGQTGVERDGKRWRVRCYWDGKKHNIGSFDLKDDALLAANAFWRDKLGMFAEQRDQVKFWMVKKKKEEVKKKRKSKHVRYYDLFSLPYDTEDNIDTSERKGASDVGRDVSEAGSGDVPKARKHQKDRRSNGRKSVTDTTGDGEDEGRRRYTRQFAEVGHGFAGSVFSGF